MTKGFVIAMAAVAVLVSACSGKGARTNSGTDDGAKDSVVGIDVKYATGFSVRDSADVRLVSVGAPTPQSATAPLRQGGKYHFALVHSDDAAVPEGYTKVRVPITNTICMTSLQLSNFTILDAHDVVKGLTGTKNLFNEDKGEGRPHREDRYGGKLRYGDSAGSQSAGDLHLALETWRL